MYLYSLRIAVLDHAIASSSSLNRSSLNTAPGVSGAPSHSKTTTSLVRSNTTTTASTLARPSLRHSVTSSIKPQDGWTNALLSLADTFKDKDSSASAQKSSRFPKEFVKVLDVKMERVAKGADPKHQDQLLRQTIGAYYGTFAQASFQKNLKENRQIEEVILMFVTTASSILKKRLGAEGDEWKRELNHQVAQFVVMIRDGLKSCGRVPGELVNRLDSYLTKLAEPPLEAHATTHHDRHLSIVSAASTATTTASYPSYSPSLQSASSPAAAAAAALNSPSGAPSSNRNSSVFESSLSAINLSEMPFVQALGDVFGKTESELKRDVQNLKRICTEQVESSTFPSLPQS